MKISNITVCYNSANTIGDTINSVASQTYYNKEHIVVDGLSTDETMDIVRSSPSVSRFISEPDSGIYDAMNKGLSLASGDVVGFLNADDFYVDQHVLEKIALAFEDPSVDITYGDLVYVTQDNSQVLRYWKSKQFVEGDFAKGWCPAHPTFYVRKSKIAELGWFDLNYKLAADVEFMMRYLEKGKLNPFYIPHVLVRMRIGGVSNQSWRSILKQNKEVFLALSKNGIQFSKFNFVIFKLINRLRQFFKCNLPNS